MWYEILPSLGIVWACMTIPQYTAKVMNWAFLNGKTSARYWDNNIYDWHLYYRDLRVTGSEYVPRGLEALDEEKK